MKFSTHISIWLTGSISPEISNFVANQTSNYWKKPRCLGPQVSNITTMFTLKRGSPFQPKRHNLLGYRIGVWFIRKLIPKLRISGILRL